MVVRYVQQPKEGQKYFPNHFLTDLLMFITYPAPLWDWIHVWPFLVIRLDDMNEKEAIGRVNNSRVRSNDSEGKASKANNHYIMSQGPVRLVPYGITAISIEY